MAYENVKDNPLTVSQEIHFPNGRTAKMVTTPVGQDPIEILCELKLKQPQALILISGGASGLEENHKNRLLQLFSRAIARAAADVEATIIDGGNQSGVMEMMGQGVADRGRKSILIGVSPAGKVTYPGMPEPETDIEGRSPLDPNHTHFILVNTDEWGGETSTMFNVGKTLADRTIDTTEISTDATQTKKEAEAKGTIPVVTVLTNGGSISKKEALYSVRQNWPIIIIEGSGRAADEILSIYYEKPERIDDPMIAEIVEEGSIYSYPIDAPIEGMERLIKRLLREDETLKMTWETFAVYDYNANRQRDRFETTHNLILKLGVLGTGLAILKTLAENKGFGEGILKILNFLNFAPETAKAFADKFVDIFHSLFHVIILLIPISTAALINAFSKFSPGNKRIFLRASAESLKREIYSYRARALSYSEKETLEESRESKLAEKLNIISTQLMQTEVNLSSLYPYKGPIPPNYGAAPGDDGFSTLTPEKYVTVRLDDQLTYYKSKTNKLENEHKKLQKWIWIFGGVGTFLAAIGLEIWIALTTVLVGAITTYMEVHQIESNLTKFNQAATDLTNVRSWWMALSPEQQARSRNIDTLVKRTEDILESEFAGWLQQMQEALEELEEELAEQAEGQPIVPIEKIVAKTKNTILEEKAAQSESEEEIREPGEEENQDTTE